MCDYLHFFRRFASVSLSFLFVFFCSNALFEVKNAYFVVVFSFGVWVIAKKFAKICSQLKMCLWRIICTYEAPTLQVFVVLLVAIQFLLFFFCLFVAIQANYVHLTSHNIHEILIIVIIYGKRSFLLMCLSCNLSPRTFKAGILSIFKLQELFFLRKINLMEKTPKNINEEYLHIDPE